jgi:hypothetical protein
MPTVHPEVIVENVTEDHNEIHEDYSKAWNRRERMVPCIADGVTDNTAIIDTAHDDATPGDMLVFPRGPIAINPITFAKMLHIRGAGRFSTWFVPLTNSTDPLITVERTIDSGHGIFANYGTILEGFGINRQGHMAGPCLRTEPSAAHLTYKDVLCSGGTRGVEHHAPNALMDGLHLWDPSDCMLDMDENGLEVHMRYVVMAANVTDVDAYWRVTISPAASGGLLGGIYYGDVSCRSDPAVTVTNGLVITADSSTEVPTFPVGMVVDNVNGGGPVIDLVNVQSVSLKGWANGTNGCVRMDGCTGVDVEMRTRGGTHTFEFVGDSTTGFKSRSEVFTGPAYKITGTAPTEVDVDDWVAAATTIAQVTNNAGWLLNAARRTWSSLRLQGMLRQREVGAAAPQGFGDMVAGVLTVSHTGTQTNSRVEYWRGTTGLTGTPGILIHDVADNIAGTSFTIRSTSLNDTGRVHWRFLGDSD